MRKKQIQKKKLKVISSALAMADIALLLLIFFMVSTSIVSDFDQEIDLPKSNFADGVEIKEVLFSVKNEGELFLNNQKISLEDLSNILENEFPYKEQPVIIQADGKAEYKLVSSLITTLQDNEYNNLTFMTAQDANP